VLEKRRIHPYERIHAHLTPMSIFERLSWRIGSWNWRCWRERRLPLNKYSAFMKHTDVKPGVWTLMDWRYNHPPNHLCNVFCNGMNDTNWPEVWHIFGTILLGDLDYVCGVDPIQVCHTEVVEIIDNMHDLRLDNIPRSFVEGLGEPIGSWRLVALDS
jgi:hypothetical protein